MARPTSKRGRFLRLLLKSNNRARASIAKDVTRTGPCSSMPFRDRHVAEFVDLRAVKRWWRQKMGKFGDYEYRKQPGFDMNTFEGANQAIPMKTLVIYCFDPRAAEIPQAVAAY